MKVRRFLGNNAPTKNINEAIYWAIGANHGYSEACKDHQELVDALENLLLSLNRSQQLQPQSFSQEQHLYMARQFDRTKEEARSVLAKYKGE